MDNSVVFDVYIQELQKNLSTGVATEHTYRHALKALIESMESNINAINEPRHVECGAPDYIITCGITPVGYIEAKDMGADLHKEEKSDQLKRYLKSLNNLILTDYVEFHRYLNGEHRETARIGEITRDNKIRKNKEGVQALSDLLKNFLAEETPSVGRPQELAKRMADLARMICAIINETFNREGETDLHAQYKAFQETLIPDLKPSEFADMYAQTIAYGLFSARLRIPDGHGFSREKASWNLPKTNPFLRKLFNVIAGPDLDPRIAWLVDDLANLLAHSDMTEILRDFGRRIRQEDPVVHFYETFLSEYNPKERMKRGVFYTPEPVVSYIVRSIDHILKTRFDCPMGLADQKTIILDPAVGTGTFLYFVIQRIYETLIEMGQKGLWNNYVKDHLLPRVFGFELLMAPYTVAHTKLGILLQETGYDFSGDQRLGIYLTNALEQAFTSATHLGFSEFIVDEANSADEIKRDKPVMVILGNPPYSVSSANKSKHIEGLMESYKQQVKTEKSIVSLSDDYIKFIRFAHDRIERTGYGIIGMITNNSYLSGLIHRGMREELLKTFDEIYILNLHGNSITESSTPDGKPDENVFDIRQGVAISLFIKLMDKKHQAVIRYADLWGLREHKYISLLENDINTSEWLEIKSEDLQNFFFVPKNLNFKVEYEKGWKITDIFSTGISGVKTHRDDVLVSFDETQLMERFKDISSNDNENELKTRYGIKDTPYWKLSDARKNILLQSVGEFIKPYFYRPFDFRYIYYNPQIIERGDSRWRIMRHMLSKNLSLLCMRQVSLDEPYSHFGVSRSLIDNRVFYSNRGILNLYPLYLYNIPSETKQDLFDTFSMNRQPNLSPKFIAFVKEKLEMEFIPDGKGDMQKTFGPEDILHYAYAIFHSPTYRERYAEFLKIDFPRLPITSDRELFKALANKGEELVSLHLMESPALNHLITGFPISGASEVEKVRYVDQEPGRVYINKDQYFDGIDPELWKFQIGGYQVLHKWLNDRKGRNLSFDDLFHYQRIVIALKETIRIMKEIDSLIPKFPIE
jgi:type I restriction-modification system DNA methylase subunit